MMVVQVVRWRIATYSRLECGLNLRTEGNAARVLQSSLIGSGAEEGMLSYYGQGNDGGSYQDNLGAGEAVEGIMGRFGSGVARMWEHVIRIEDPYTIIWGSCKSENRPMFRYRIGGS